MRLLLPFLLDPDSCILYSPAEGQMGVPFSPLSPYFPVSLLASSTILSLIASLPSHSSGIPSSPLNAPAICPQSAYVTARPLLPLRCT